METAVFASRVVGPLFVLIGVGLIMNAPEYRTMLRGFTKDSFAVYVSGLLASLMGLLLVMSQTSVNVLMMVGTAGIIKGTSMLLFPKWTMETVKRMDLSENLLRASGLLCLALGGYVCFLGFF